MAQRTANNAAAWQLKWPRLSEALCNELDSNAARSICIAFHCHSYNGSMAQVMNHLNSKSLFTFPNVHKKHVADLLGILDSYKCVPAVSQLRQAAIEHGLITPDGDVTPDTEPQQPPPPVINNTFIVSNGQAGQGVATVAPSSMAPAALNQVHNFLLESEQPFAVDSVDPTAMFKRSYVFCLPNDVKKLPHETASSIQVMSFESFDKARRFCSDKVTRHKEKHRDETMAYTFLAVNPETKAAFPYTYKRPTASVEENVFTG